MVTLALPLAALVALAASSRSPAQEVPEPTSSRPAAREEPAAYLESVRFIGNEQFSDRRLRSAAGLAPRRWWRLGALRGAAAYAEEEWAAIEARLEAFYRGEGFLDADVGAPEVSRRQGRGPEGRPIEWVTLDVPVQEGQRYRVGSLTVTGTTAVTPEEAREHFDIEAGDAYEEARLREGLRELQAVYARRGYLTWTAEPRLAPAPGQRSVDVVVAVEEGPRFWVGRIEFGGTDRTRQEMLRREVRLTEGELFDAEQLARSVQRLDGLGFFEPLTPPAVVPDPERPQFLNVTFALEERAPVRWDVGGGLSDLEGASATTSVSIVNALGRGEVARVSAQFGGSIRVLALSGSKLYPFGLPFTGRLEAYASRFDFEAPPGGPVPSFREERVGATLWTEHALGPSARWVNGYIREQVTLEPLEDEPELPILEEGERDEAALSSAVFRRGIPLAWKPRQGLDASLGLRWADALLGASREYVRAESRLFAAVPHTRRTALTLMAGGGLLVPLGNTGERDPDTGLNRLPFERRFALGGETQVRGFEARSIGPRDRLGRVVGGTRFLLLGAEYHLDVSSGFQALAFFDAGQAFAEDVPIDLGRLRTSTGLELRVRLPFIGLPLRLIGAYNPHRDAFHPEAAFRVAVGPL